MSVMLNAPPLEQLSVLLGLKIVKSAPDDGDDDLFSLTPHLLSNNFFLRYFSRCILYYFSDDINNKLFS